MTQEQANQLQHIYNHINNTILNPGVDPIITTKTFSYNSGTNNGLTFTYTVEREGYVIFTLGAGGGSNSSSITPTLGTPTVIHSGNSIGGTNQGRTTTAVYYAHAGDQFTCKTWAYSNASHSSMYYIVLIPVGPAE